MSNIPPYQMSAPPGGPPPKTGGTAAWVWVLVGLAGMCVICGVIGAAVLFPVFAQARQAARQTVSLSMAKQIATSTALYRADYDDRFPPIESGPQVTKVLAKYLSANSQFSNRRGPTLETKASESTWNTSLSKLQASTIDNSPQLWMFYTKEPPELKRLSLAFVARDWQTKEVGPDGKLFAMRFLGRR
jgi:hypothetical protein